MFDIKNSFDNYRQIISSITTDLEFWREFLELSINNYQSQKVTPDVIYEVAFMVNDIDVSNNAMMTDSPRPIYLKTADLEEHRKLFFIWIMNLSLEKSYNALEIFLQQAIWLKYFPSLENPTISKKSSDALQRAIKKEITHKGLSIDVKNNRHLIAFLKIKSQDFEKFISLPINKDSKTTRENFFELISILRNIVAHRGTTITNDIVNDIKSKSKDIFEKYFIVSCDDNKDKHINPVESEFSNLISLTKDLTVNSVKFINNETDLKFIGMKSVSMGFKI